MSKLSKAIQLAEKAANLLKKKKSVSKDDVIKYSGDHGVPNAKKFLGKERVSKAGAKFTKDTTKRQKEMAKKSETSKAKRQLRTPTGTKTAPKKAPKKPASRKKTSAEARKGARNRSEEGKQSYTTRVGEGAGNSPKSKDLSKEDKKRLHKKRRVRRKLKNLVVTLNHGSTKKLVLVVYKAPVAKLGVLPNWNHYMITLQIRVVLIFVVVRAMPQNQMIRVLRT